MYQSSQCYSGGCSGSRLEYLAAPSGSYTSSSGVAYTIDAVNAAAALSYTLEAVACSLPPSSGYASFSPESSSTSSLSYALFHPHTEYHFIPESFLKPDKQGIFVGRAEEIREYIKLVFTALMEQPFPEDIKITVCDEQQFRTIAPHPGTVGVSFNRSKYGLLSEIFVLNGSLAKVMLTIGHELGHVLTAPLDDAHTEEAKAYAFSLAWMKIIQEQNIAGLGKAFITENPAQNGLHNMAFQMVSRLLALGHDAWSIYRELIHGELFYGSSSI